MIKIRKFPLDLKLDRLDCGSACIEMRSNNFVKFSLLLYYGNKCRQHKDCLFHIKNFLVGFWTIKNIIMIRNITVGIFMFNYTISNGCVIGSGRAMLSISLGSGGLSLTRQIGNGFNYYYRAVSAICFGGLTIS